jgi:hypothetical protein
VPFFKRRKKEMSNKKTILNEAAIRRWGKLAAIGKPLTENWLDALTEEDEELAAEEEPAGEEMPGEEMPGEEMPAAEEGGEGEIVDRVEDIVSAVVQAISDEVPEANISMEAGEEGEEPAAEEAPAEEAPAEEEVPANRDEDLGLDIIDDDELTEAVLKRVVERLLKRK